MSFWSHSRFQGVHPTTLFMVFDICDKDDPVFLKWLQDKKLIASHYECYSCRKPMSLSEDVLMPDGYVWKCSSKEGLKHTVKRSIRRGTFFEHSKFSLRDIIQLAYYWYKEYPHRTVHFELRTNSPRQILDWYNFCKGACVDILFKLSTPIGGQGIKIELYECKFWKRSVGDDHKVVSMWLYCGLERDSTNCFLVNAVDKSPRTIVRILKTYVLPGSIVYSDIWRENDTERDVNSQLPVNQELTFRDMENGGVGNTTEGIWTMIKKQFPAAKRSKSLFNAFISEFMYRRILNEAQDGFSKFLSDLAEVYTPSTSG